MIVVDVWGGENSNMWMARMIRPVEEALEIAKFELAAGHLVNLRSDVSYGVEHEFDVREGKA